MSDNSNEVGELTESATDVVKTAKTTSARYVFHLNIARIRELLRAGSAGINESKDKIGALLLKISDAMDNPVSDADGSEVEHLDGGAIRMRFSAREMELMKEVVSWHSALVGDLHFHLHNVLCVAAWSALEGYVQTALAELFSTNPHLLASDKRVSVAEVVAAGDDVTEYLVAKEVDDVGRKGFEDLQAYMRSKLHVQFSNEHTHKMRNIYFLRNVIAHSAGFLRRDQLSLVPEGVDVVNGELRISHEYLDGVVACLEAAVKQLDDQLRRKFTGPHSEFSRPVAGKPLPLKLRPIKTIDIPDDATRKKPRHGRPRKTGRPGQ